MRTALGVVAIVLGVIVALLMLTFGWIRTGWEIPQTQCAQLPGPEQGGPFFESTRVDGSRTWFPLGLSCTYDVSGDAFGPQTVNYYNPETSTILVISVAGVVFGVITVARARRETEGNP